MRDEMDCFVPRNDGLEIEYKRIIRHCEERSNPSRHTVICKLLINPFFKTMSGNEILELTFHETTTRNDLFCQFDDHHGVLLLDVKNPFTTEDFQTIMNIIDPYYAQHGELLGVIIHAKKFPYWSGAQNRAEYLNFARDNHFKFKKAALAMGGFFTKIVAQVARGRVHPEVKIFKYRQIEQAQNWVLGNRYR